MTRTIAIVIVMSLSQLSHSEQNPRSLGSFYTGNELLEYCEGDEGSGGFNMCIAFIAGVHDMANWTTQQRVVGESMFKQMQELNPEMDGSRAFAETFGASEIAPAPCTPKGASLGQLARVVKKFLQDHPESLHLDAGGLVYNALNEAFPCPEAK
ncbi:Rap1a/Tai family immunity protein [Pseudomonadales bacterium]|nr:Rap1a/Tai family immunity protein [Pseudomonadales bacterium]